MGAKCSRCRSFECILGMWQRSRTKCDACSVNAGLIAGCTPSFNLAQCSMTGSRAPKAKA